MHVWVKDRLSAQKPEWDDCWYGHCGFLIVWSLSGRRCAARIETKECIGLYKGYVESWFYKSGWRKSFSRQGSTERLFSLPDVVNAAFGFWDFTREADGLLGDEWSKDRHPSSYITIHGNIEMASVAWFFENFSGGSINVCGVEHHFREDDAASYFKSR